MKTPAICMYPESVSDIQKTMKIGKTARYHRIVVPITNQPLSQSDPGIQRNAFTRSDLLLDAATWKDNTILKISEFHDCDNENEMIWKKSVQKLKREINWAKHQCSDHAIVLVSLKNDQSANLAREFLNRFDTYGLVLAEMPMVDKSYFTQMYGKTTAEDKIKLTTASANIWHRWNQFRFFVDFNAQFKIALEMTPELPNESDLSRWYGEPVDMIIIPSDLFKVTNNNNGIYLEEHLQNVCLKFFYKIGTHFAVKCNSNDPWVDHYATYMRSLFTKKTHDGNHVCNRIDRRLNAAGLIFSSKPNEIVNRCDKYQKKLFNLYTKAVRLAIADRIQTDEKINLMLCGSGSWKLLSPLIALVEDPNTIEMFIYEEDPNMQILISDIIESLYANIKITIIGDSGMEKYYRKMDIVVSITLSSIYESQWLQVNFNRVCNYIRSDAIMIPRKSGLSVVPVLSANAYSFLQRCPQIQYRNETHGHERHEIRSQVVCPIYTRNFYECSTSQELFVFPYRLGDVEILSDHRYKMLTFTIHRDCVVTGFCGYFDATFYKDVKLSNQTWLRDDNADCVPMVYFPLRAPQVMKGQTEMKIAFQLFGCVDKKKYWYEWQTIAPITIGHQNLCGNSCSFEYSKENSC